MSEWPRMTFDPFAGGDATHKSGLGLVPSLCGRWVVG